VEKTADGIRIERQTAAGYDVVEAATPVLLSVTAGSVEPRYPSFKGIMAAKSRPVETLSVADLGVEVSSAQTITGVEPVAARQAGEIIEDDGEAHLRILALLEQRKVV